MAFLPRYCLIFDRAVKLVRMEDGGAHALVYNAVRDEFEDPPPELARYLLFPNDEAEEVTEAEFKAYVEKLRVREAARRAVAPEVKNEP